MSQMRKRKNASEAREAVIQYLVYTAQRYDKKTDDDFLSETHGVRDIRQRNRGIVAVIRKSIGQLSLNSFKFFGNIIDLDMDNFAAVVAAAYMKAFADSWTAGIALQYLGRMPFEKVHSLLPV